MPRCFHSCLLEELRFWLSFPHTFTFQVKRMGTIQETLELFQIMPSPLHSCFLWEEIQWPYGCLTLIFTHPLVSLGTPAPANGVLHLERDTTAAKSTSWAHKHVPGCVNHQCHKHMHAFPWDVQSWLRSDCSRPVQECFLSMWQMLLLVTASYGLNWL